jgi:DNA polymerase-3 subunit epsilon
MAGMLKGIQMLDALTVYRDRRAYPHRLENAIAAYGVELRNTHRAIDDARAALEVLRAMEAERADLTRYINLFGYNPKYGVTGPRISSVRYAAQGYNERLKLYEK